MERPWPQHSPVISWLAGESSPCLAGSVATRLQTNTATMLDPYGQRVALAMPATVLMPHCTRGL